MSNWQCTLLLLEVRETREVGAALLLFPGLGHALSKSPDGSVSHSTLNALSFLGAMGI